MFISELRIQNVKRIVALGIAPGTGEPVILTGDNAQGKSSVLDAIFLALQNKGLEDPIRHGASKATVKLTIHGTEGEYIIERNITKKSRTLKITGADGADIPSPQAFIDGLIGSLAFDPLEFVRMKPKVQAIAIRELVGLDTSALDADYRDTFARRTEVNRTLATAEAQLKAMTKPEVPSTPDEIESSAITLIQKREEMTEVVGEARAAVDAHEQANRTYGNEAAKLAALREQLKAQEEALTVASEKCKTAKEFAAIAASRSPGTEAIAKITSDITAVDEINAAIRSRREAKAAAQRAVEAYEAKATALRTARANSDTLTARLATIEETKTTLSGAVKMPVQGMTFDEDGVLIDGVRFDQLSTAEQVRVSAAVAMRGNPKLRLILVREGALLNKANLEAICESAKEKDYQIFIEKFQEQPGITGLHIEDGAITHINGESVKQPELEGVEA
ncbi:MAG: AAA family ATPase [Verrucomicrobiota bacterium]